MACEQKPDPSLGSHNETVRLSTTLSPNFSPNASLSVPVRVPTPVLGGGLVTAAVAFDVFATVF
jgi:hypothetical protein